MTTKTWNFIIEGQPHILAIERKGLRPDNTLLLDGQILEVVSYYGPVKV